MSSIISQVALSMIGNSQNKERDKPVFKKIITQARLERGSFNDADCADLSVVLALLSPRSTCTWS